MASKFVLVCEVADTGGTVAGEIAPSSSVPGQCLTTGAGAWDTVQNIGAYLQNKAIGSGIKITYFDTAVSASTTGTFTADPTAADTITINGVVFTARASGAVANEFNFVVGSVTLTAAALAAAINASTTAGIVGTVGASSALGVVTFFATVPGSAGLNIPITESLGGFTLAAVTFATGGTQSHNAVISAGV